MTSTTKISDAKYTSQTTYDRAELKTDIVHLGFGAFHRGHQAVYNDLSNEATGKLWGICEVNLFGPEDLIGNLQQQKGLFTVVEKSASNTHTRLIRTISESIHTPVDGIERAIAKMVEPQVKIVSLTITEKGYCTDPQSGRLDLSNDLIQFDLKNPRLPKSAIGCITEALRQRRELSLMPFSVLSCDNIPENGLLTKDAVVSFAQALDPVLAHWIEEHVTFPSTMVDRIVPAMTDDQFDVIEQETGYRDPCGIVCEDFRQWVVEDNFVAGRPDWDAAGAMFVGDVLPYEEMKLRMLNGSHSFLAYNGSLAGHEFIYECMQDEALKAATLRLMTQEQAKSLQEGLEVNLETYANLLIQRFSNTNIKHKTGQIAMDGSQKLPQRSIDPFMTLQRRGIDRVCLPVAIAGWMHYTINQALRGETIFDPLEAIYKEIALSDAPSVEKANALLSIEKIFGSHKSENPEFHEKVIEAFMSIESKGINAVIDSIAKN
ncbi:mannitol dehydrogenase family protein [Vibrio sp. SCSIO 43140]|uniref:mannitol dehydrogenase family protein n=1 Tax=Vibrio sp. SCSIO 43140 TaxID=2819100 RepID=UPI0020751082|nr:mannitol dehydrogenase family protein [Vibrio sp. SCSIO 43140]USD62494.1 mannitol dehydrogenase family protein [Vibrio sp. SCSIO 43140]